MKLSSYDKIAQTVWFIYFLKEIYFLTLLEAQAPNASRAVSGETSLLDLQMVPSQCPYMAFSLRGYAERLRERYLWCPFS